ncbi:MAG: recombination mediator RecR [Candidatus Paceibacterota bacterium]
MKIPTSIKNFIDSFSRLPSVGPRMAHRLAFHILNMEKHEIKSINEAIAKLKDVDRCPVCFFIKNTNEKVCSICSDKNRNKKEVLIIEKETDLISIENSQSFNGIYLIIGQGNIRGGLSDKQKKRIKNLKNLVNKKNTKLNEVIIALNQTTEGDMTYQLIKKEIEEITSKISKLGRGLPTGGEIEFADEETLSNALDSRS